MEQARRDAAWKALFEAANEVRTVLIEDNGGTAKVDPEDEWLAHMIGEMDRILTWDAGA